MNGEFQCLKILKRKSISVSDKITHYNVLLCMDYARCCLRQGDINFSWRLQKYE